MMVSNKKRSRFISESTTDEDMGDMEYTPNNQQNKSGRKPTRTPKCFSKNALMARENRLKKKVYISDLENQVTSLNNENKKLTAIVENQSFMIQELKKEVKYLKSVISNSENIGKLIRTINSGTGMPVTSSFAKISEASIKSIAIKSPIATKTVPNVPNYSANLHQNKVYNSCFNNNDKHPWEEKEDTYVNYPTPDSTNSYYSNPDFDELNNERLLLDLDIPLEMSNDDLLGIISEQALESPMDSIKEHNYHNPLKYEQNTSNSEDEVGVCLHVSKNKLSLEFCPSCSDNALQNSSLT